MKKDVKKIFLVTMFTLLLVSITAIGAADVDKNTTDTSTDITPVKNTEITKEVKTATNDNKVLKDDKTNTIKKEKINDNEKTTSKKTVKTSDNTDYYVSDSTGSDSNTGTESSPFKTIQTAIDKTTSTSTYNIHITEGTYKGTGNTNLTVNGDYNINFIGDGINKTILDGEVNYTIGSGTVWGNDPYFNTYTIHSGNWGMNITQGTGKITIKNMNFQHMVSTGGSSITSYNTSTIDNYGNLEVDNVYFFENLAGVGAGIRNNNVSTLLVTNSIFESNRKSNSTGNFGAGIYNNGTATIINSSFIGNAARWGTITNDKIINIINSTFKDGKAYNLASSYKFGSAIATNTNTADFYNKNGTFIGLITNITGCTFENNQQTDIYQGKGNLFVTNCTFKNSTGIYLASTKANETLKYYIENSTFTDMQNSSMFYTLNTKKGVAFAIYDLSPIQTSIKNNNITVSPYAYALYLNSNNTVEDNNINGYIYITGNNTTIKDNTITSSRNYAIELKNINTTNNIITDNTIKTSLLTGNKAVKINDAQNNTIENNVPEIGETYNINDDNYNTIFDDDGNLDTTKVTNGSLINIISLNNKSLNIDNSNIFITNYDNNTILNNCSITINSNAQVVIYGLKIVNTNSNDYVIKLNSKYNLIEANNITSTTQSPIHTIIITADGNTIYNNTITTNGPENSITYDSDGYGIADTIGLLIQSSANTIEANVITTNYTTTQTYGTLEGISIQDKITRHAENYLNNNTIKTQAKNYAYGINMINTDNNIISNAIVNTISSSYANGIQVVDSHNNDINAKITVKSDDVAYGVIISGTSQTAENNTISELTISDITSDKTYGVELYNTNNTAISSNDSASVYYLHGNYSTMIGLYNANYTEISYILPYVSGKTGTVDSYDVLKPTTAAFNVVNSSHVSINGINYTSKKINNYAYNTQGNYVQITNSSYVYVGKLIKGDYIENATVNMTGTPIIVKNSNNINITGMNMSTNSIYTIVFNNTNNSEIKNNVLINNKGYTYGQNTILLTDSYNNVLSNNTPTTANKTAVYLTNDNYNQYFSSQTYTGTPTTIVIASDLYNKNMTFNKQVTVDNPSRFTVYNTTITASASSILLNDLDINNTDTRTNTIIIKASGVTLNNSNIYVENSNQATIITANNKAIITNNNINATGNKILAIYLDEASSSNISNNTIKIDATNATAMYLSEGNSITITKNNLNIITGVNTYGVFIIQSDKTYVENNTIIIMGTDKTVYAIATGATHSRTIYIRYNYLLSPTLCGDKSCNVKDNWWNEVTCENNTPTTMPSTLNTLSLKNKSLKTANDGLITEENYNDYFDENGIFKGSTEEITLGSDLYNKNMIFTTSVEFSNMNGYTLYNTTITVNGSNVNPSFMYINIENENKETCLNLINASISLMFCNFKSNSNNTTTVIKAVNSDSSFGRIMLGYCVFDITANNAIFLNSSNVQIDAMLNNITINTKTSNPVLISNNCTVNFALNVIVSNDNSTEPLIECTNSSVSIFWNYLLKPSFKANDCVKLIDSEINEDDGPFENYPENTYYVKSNVVTDNLAIGKDNNITIEVLDLLGNKINEGKITVKINNEEIGTYDISTGLAAIQYNPSAKEDYTIEVAYKDENSNYSQTMLVMDEDEELFGPMEYNVTKVLPALYPTTLELDSISDVDTGVESTVSGRLYYGDQPIDSATLNVVVTSGNTTTQYTTTTDSLGLFNLNIPNNEANVDKTVEVVFAGDNDYYYKSSNSTTYHVNAINTKLTINPVEDAKVNTTSTITGTLTTTDGTPIQDATITITINNQTITTTTDSTGTYTTTITNDKVQTTIIKVEYDGDSTYLSSANETSMNVLKLNVNAVLSNVTATIGKNTTLTVRINDENGNAVNSGKVVFKVNGITIRDAQGNPIYAQVVNGVAQITTSFNLNNKYYTLYVVYSGDSTYESARENSTLSMVQKECTISLDAPATATLGEEITLKLTVTDDDTVINSGKAVFKLNGKTLRDDDGNVLYAKVVNNVAELKYTIPTKLRAKTYNITAVYGSSSTYNRTEITNQITLNKTVKTIATMPEKTNNISLTNTNLIRT